MPPLTVMIKPVSGACNMRCDYCFYADVMNRRDTAIYPRMTLQTLEMLVRRAIAYADGSVTFCFQGGEPTLAGIDFFRALVALERMYNTRALRVSNAIQTNGYDLSDEMIRFFAREHFLVGVSLDGDRALHDAVRRDAQARPTYDRVRANLDRLLRAGVPCNILCVVNRAVSENAARVFQALAPYGYLQFIARLDDLDGTPRPDSLTESGYLRFLCAVFDLYFDAYMAGRPVSIRNFDAYIGILLGREPDSCAMSGQCGQYFLVESDGSVYPCDFYVLDEWRIGNIRDVSFRRLASDARGRDFLEASRFVPAPCRACRWAALCRNGCRRERDPQTGLNKWCKCFRAFFEYAYPRMKTMAARCARQD